VSAYVSPKRHRREDAVMSAQTLPQVKMPNRDGSVSDWPPRRGTEKILGRAFNQEDLWKTLSRNVLFAAFVAIAMRNRRRSCSRR